MPRSTSRGCTSKTSASLPAGRRESDRPFSCPTDSTSPLSTTSPGCYRCLRRRGTGCRSTFVRRNGWHVSRWRRAIPGFPARWPGGTTGERSASRRQCFVGRPANWRETLTPVMLSAEARRHPRRRARGRDRRDRYWIYLATGCDAHPRLHVQRTRPAFLARGLLAAHMRHGVGRSEGGPLLDQRAACRDADSGAGRMPCESR
jgi:hypothetical protein